MGDFQVLSDSGYDYAGYALGPSSGHLQRGTLGSCLTHIFLVKAAELDISLNSLEVKVHGEVDPKGGDPEFPEAIVEPQQITYEVILSAPEASAEDLERLLAVVQRSSLILKLIHNPWTVTRSLTNTA